MPRCTASRAVFVQWGLRLNQSHGACYCLHGDNSHRALFDVWEQATTGHEGQIQEVVFHVVGRHFVRSRQVYESLRSLASEEKFIFAVHVEKGVFIPR